MSIKILESAIQNNIDIQKQSIELLETFKTKCDRRDIQFIVDNCGTLRDLDKLISMYRQILEKTISVAHTHKSAKENDLSVGFGSVEPVDLSDSQTAYGDIDFEEKYRPDDRGSRFFTEEYVDLTKRHVTFKEAITVVHFPKEMDHTNTTESVPISATEMDVHLADEGEAEEKTRPSSEAFHIEELANVDEQHDSSNETVTVEMEDTTTIEHLPTGSGETTESLDPKEEMLPLTMTHSRPKLFGRALRKAKQIKKLQNLKKKAPNASLKLVNEEIDNSVVSERIQKERINFQQNLNRTTGQCFLCDERRLYTKAQWQNHVLSHTKEHFYFCDNCGHTFMALSDHSSCPSATITNIFDRYDCVGEDYLAAFVCHKCDYVRVSESRMVKHLNVKHGIGENFDRFYEKCKFVNLVEMQRTNC